MSESVRQRPRISFTHQVNVHILAIDGTWRRDCTMLDVSESGVLLAVKGPLAGLNLKEFFLLLSSTGLTYRRCELVRVDGDRIGAHFLKHAAPKKIASLRDRKPAIESAP